MLIRTETDLLALMAEQSLIHPFRRPAALLDIPQFTPKEGADWGARLEHLRNQSGCTAAIIGLGGFTLASLLYVLAAALQTTPGSEPDYPTILFNGALFSAGLVFSALLGKLVGLILAALRFRRTCRALRIRLKILSA